MIATKPVWSWVSPPPDEKQQPAIRPGRYSRPLSIRDRVIAEAFGKEICRLRERRELSTRELAQRIGVSQPWITKIEKGRGNIELRLIWDLADALDVSPKQFLRVCQEAVGIAQAQHNAEQKK